MALIDFDIELVNTSTALDLVEDALLYATQITGNQLTDTGLNSGYRFLTEAFIYLYSDILTRLSNYNDELEESVYKLFSINVEGEKAATALLKITLLQTYSGSIFIPRIPVRAINGTIWVTDAILVIPAGSRNGYINATCVTTGEVGNLPANSINNPSQILDFPILVTNESESSGGNSANNLVAAKAKLARIVSEKNVGNRRNYQLRLEDYNPQLYCDIVEETNRSLRFYVGKKDGKAVLDSELPGIKDLLNSVKYIGINQIYVDKIELIPIFIQLSLKVDSAGNFQTESNNIASTLQTYLVPGNQIQFTGIVLLEELKRSISGFSYQFLQSMRIGNNETDTQSSNFTYARNQRVFCRQIRITATDTFQSIDYTTNY